MGVLNTDSYGIVAVALMASLLAITVGGCLLRSTRRRGRSTGELAVTPASSYPSDTEARRDAGTLGARLVVAAVIDTVVVLDCVVDDEASPVGPVGVPFSLRVVRPKTAELDQAAVGLLTKWADDDEVVRLAMHGVEPTRTVEVSCHGSVLRLDVEVSPVGKGHRSSREFGL